MKKIIVSALLFSSLTNVYAQSCLRTFDTNLKDERATCISTDSLYRNLDKREAGEGFMRVYESFISEFPGAGTALTLIKEITGHDESERGSNQRFVEELRGVLDRYEDETRFVTNTNDPKTLVQTSRLSIATYSELGQLLREKRFTEEEKEIIREKMEKLRNIAALMITEASVNINTAISAKLNQDIEVLKKELVGKIEKLETDFLSAQNSTITDLNDRIKSLSADLKSVKDLAGKSVIEREIKEAKLLLQRNIETQIRDIHHYKTFANGLLSVYSLLEPEKAQRLNQAVSGISQIASAYIQFSNIESMSTAAILGNYGNMSMGSVQVMNAFSSKKDAQGEAFNKIFKQLLQLSKQIDGLQANMNSRFDATTNQLMSVEAAILSNLENLHKKVNRIEAMSEYGVMTLNKIDLSLRDLIDFVTSNDISKEIQASYLVHVNKCIGRDKIELLASSKEAKACFEGMHTWLKTKLNSSQLTKRMVPGQYQTRNLFEYQVNDLVESYRLFRPESHIETVSNPSLLNDVERSIEILNKNYYFGVSKKEYKSAKGYIEREKEKLNILRKTLNEDKEFLIDLISSYKRSLVKSHKLVSEAYDVAIANSSVSYSSEKLISFISLLKNEIAYRRDVDSLDISKAVNPSEKAYFQELLFTQQTMRNMLEQAEVSLSNLNIESDPVIFAESCDVTSEYRIPLPLSKKFLVSKVGEDLYRRIALRPQSFKPCYNIEYMTWLNIPQGRVTYGVDTEISWAGTFTNTRALGDFAKSVNHEASGIRFTFSKSGNLAYSSIRSSSKHIGKFSLKATFDGKEVLDETLDLPKKYREMGFRAGYPQRVDNIKIKLPLYKGKSDPFALLGLYSGSRYFQNYPFEAENFKGSIYHEHYATYSPNPIVVAPVPAEGGLVAYADSFYESLLLKDTYSTQKVQNMLSSLNSSNQKELLLTEKSSLMNIVQIDFLKSLETFKTGEIDEALRFLNLAVYFRNPSLYELDDELTHAMSEIWGLRSGANLKKFYKDVFAVSKTRDDLEKVLKTQLDIVQKLEKKLELNH